MHWSSFWAFKIQGLLGMIDMIFDHNMHVSYKYGLLSSSSSSSSSWKLWYPTQTDKANEPLGARVQVFQPEYIFTCLLLVRVSPNFYRKKKQGLCGVLRHWLANWQLFISIYFSCDTYCSQNMFWLWIISEMFKQYQKYMVFVRFSFLFFFGHRVILIQILVFTTLFNETKH